MLGYSEGLFAVQTEWTGRPNPTEDHAEITAPCGTSVACDKHKDPIFPGFRRQLDAPP